MANPVAVSGAYESLNRHACVVQPGVDALGYVKRTTPPLLASTSAFRVVSALSFVCTVPPNPSSETLLPTTIPSDALAADAFGAGLESFASLFLEGLGAAFAFLLGPAACGGGVLRLRSSTIVASEMGLFGCVGELS